MTKNDIFISLKDGGEAVDPASAHRNINRRVPWEQGLLKTLPFTLRTAISVTDLRQTQHCLPVDAWNRKGTLNSGLRERRGTLVSVWTRTREPEKAPTGSDRHQGALLRCHVPMRTQSPNLHKPHPPGLHHYSGGPYLLFASVYLSMAS